MDQTLSSFRAPQSLVERYHRRGLWRDTGPLAEALEQLLVGRFQVTLFTTGVQIEHFLTFANERGQREAAAEALRQTFIASIGPDCSDSLRACGLEAALEPSHPKMGLLVREAAMKYGEKGRF